MTSIMKKHIFIITLVVMALVLCGGIKAEAQVFKTSGKTASELCPDHKFVSVEGDFNKDGVKDLFINVNDEACAFYFGNADGGYTLFRDYDVHLYEGAKLSVTDKGVLRIQSGEDVFLFRYQDNAFVLIGGKHGEESYNFLTDKKVETIGSGTSKKYETSELPPHHPFKFGWFPFDWEILWPIFILRDENGGFDPDCMLTFGIYRRMQLEDKVDWFMNDPESEKGKDFPCPGEDSGAYGYCERPGMYNMDVTITFTKLTNDTYKIVSNATIQNREYESELYNYISEHPEYEDLDFAEQMAKAGLSIPDDEHNVFTEYFVDGKFVDEL